MPQNIFKADFLNPEFFGDETSPIVLFPTDRRFSRQEYEAVMASKVFLRDWSGSTWPSDEFTEGENFNEMKHLVFDNIRHSAYGYMIGTGDRSRCLGGVYVNPLGNWGKSHKLVEGNDPSRTFDARIDYWVRTDEPKLDEKILTLLQGWFRDEWKIKTLLVTRESFAERNRAIKDLNLPRVVVMESLKNAVRTEMFELT